jgi:GT2 family glycosyltransferase
VEVARDVAGGEMSIAVVIPSKTASNLAVCVAAKVQHEPGCLPLFIIDDGVGTLPDVCDGATVIQGLKSFIYARNCNLGIRAALENQECSGVVLLNDDAILDTPQGFTVLAKFADEHPEVGCVAPSTNITGQPLQWPKHRTPQGWRIVDTVPYVCVFIPRRTFERVGLLDERYCIDYGVEDLDHTTAMTRAGLKVAVVYDVFVDHGSLHSSFRGDPHAPKSFAKNYALYKAKWGIA